QPGLSDRGRPGRNAFRPEQPRVDHGAVDRPRGPRSSRGIGQLRHAEAHQTMKPSRRIRAALGIAAAALTLAAATGCFNPFSPRTRSERAVSSPPPVPSSPDQVIELFAWCWRNRAYQEYTEIFTDDFRFQFSVRDTAGQGGRGEFLDRTAELETARHLFIEGNANEPPARSITLEFTGTLRPEPDSRDGQNGLIKKTPWHYQIATDVLLR